MPVPTILHHDNDSDSESDAVSRPMHQDVNDSHGDNNGESVSNEGDELLSFIDSD